MEHIKQIKTRAEFPFISEYSNEMRYKVNCVQFDNKAVISQLSPLTFLDGFTSILVLSGNATININYKEYQVIENSLMLLASSHLFSFKECSLDFKCLSLFVSKEFIDEMDSTDMINRRVKYGVKMYDSPIIQLNNANSSLLKERLLNVDKVLYNEEHFYYKEMVLNSLFTYYLDISDIIERHTVTRDGSLTRYESIIQGFIELLMEHYREEHKVDFYASKLNISAHYLTLIAKRVIGQSVSDFIFEMLYSEARMLLIHSKLSVQEIASRLNFSDQSSFGKFFKRKSGLSPVDFRKNM